MNLPFDPNIDHYKALGLDPSASAEEIKKTYRRLAKKYHPDSTGGNKSKETRFKQVGAAYDVLGDQEKRRQYDEIRAGGFRPPHGAGGANFYQPHGAGAGGANFGGFSVGGLEDFGDLGSLFSQAFSQGGPFTQGGQGGVHFRTSHSFSQGPRSSPRRPSPPPNQEKKRRASDGSTLLQRGNNIYSDVRVDLDQAILGTVAEIATLTGKASVKIPPGTSSGAKLRLRGKGAKDTHGKTGDHFATVQIRVPKELNQKAKKLLVEFMAQTKRSEVPG